MLKTLIGVFLSFLFLNVSYAQSTDLLKERRQKLINSLAEDEMALIISYPVKQRSLDINYEYHANPSIRYFTGIDEPGLILVLQSKLLAQNSGLPEAMLFVRPENKQDAIWHGKRNGVKRSSEISGVETEVLAELKSRLSKIPTKKLSFEEPKSFGVHDPATNNERRSVQSWISKNAIQVNDRIKKEIALIREVKDTFELAQMRKVIAISCKGHLELIRASKNVLSEYEMEAVIESAFRWEGAQRPAYPSIIGGAQNSCVLHYMANSENLKKGDMVVADVGAEYNGYAADITRSFPVANSFSPEQTAIYNLVLKAQEAGIEECKAGKSFRAPNDAARKVISEGLKDLGLISNFVESRKYFMHGTSHYLGLDVHDVGSYGDLKEGNIITVEPGIYIAEGSDCDPKWWDIGVRIEDDVLITNGAPDVLSDCVPKSIEKIEATMLEPSIFDSWKKLEK